MKKIFMVLLSCFIVISCDSKKDETETPSENINTNIIEEKNIEQKDESAEISEPEEIQQEIQEEPHNGEVETVLFNFYEYDTGKLCNNLYVDSFQGTNLYKDADSKSKVIGTLPYFHVVKPVALGNFENIDGKTSQWVKVVLPRYMQKGEEMEFAWIFGSSLAKNIPEDFANSWTDEILIDYLSSSKWCSSENKHHIYSFGKDGSYIDYKIESSSSNEGTWEIKAPWKITIKSVFAGSSEFYEEDEASDYKEESPSEIKEYSLKNAVITPSYFYLDSSTKLERCIPSYDTDGEVSIDPGIEEIFVKDNASSKPLYYITYENYAQTSEKNSKLFIELGFCPLGLEELYDNYWNPILEKQKVLPYTLASLTGNDFAKYFNAQGVMKIIDKENANGQIVLNDCCASLLPTGNEIQITKGTIVNITGCYTFQGVYRGTVFHLYECTSENHGSFIIEGYNLSTIDMTEPSLCSLAIEDYFSKRASSKKLKEMIKDVESSSGKDSRCIFSDGKSLSVKNLYKAD